MTRLPLDFFGVQFWLPKEEEAEELLVREPRRQNQRFGTSNVNGSESTSHALAEKNVTQFTNDIAHKDVNQVAGTPFLHSEPSSFTSHTPKTESKDDCRVSPLKIDTRKKRACKGDLELTSKAQSKGDLHARHEAFSASIQRDIDHQLVSFKESFSSSGSDDWMPETHPDSYIGKVKAERDLRRRHFRQTSTTLIGQAKVIQLQQFGNNTIPIGDPDNLRLPSRLLKPQLDYPPYCPDIKSGNRTVALERGHDTVVKIHDTDKTVEFKDEISLYNKVQTTRIANDLEIDKNILEHTTQLATLAETMFGVSSPRDEKESALLNQEQTAQLSSNPETNYAALQTSLDASGPVTGLETEVAVAAFELGLTSTIVTPKEILGKTVTVAEQPFMAPNSPTVANEMPFWRPPLRQPLSPDRLFGSHPRVNASSGQKKPGHERYSSYEVYVPHWFPFFVSMNIMTFSGSSVDEYYIQLLNRLAELEDEATSKSIAEAKGVKLWDEEWHEPSKKWPRKHQQVHGG
jgi:hypothetical protein